MSVSANNGICGLEFDEYAQLCRTLDEALLALRCHEGAVEEDDSYDDFDPERTAKTLPRLGLALDLKCKEFVNELKVQEVMKFRWRGAWARDTYSLTEWVINVIYRFLPSTIFYPISVLIYIVTGGKHPECCRIPWGRFASFFAST